MDEVERIMAMSDEQILEWARSEGLDPEKVAADGRAMLERAIAIVDAEQTPPHAEKIMKCDIRCVEGTLWRHDPQSDDPNLETNVGKCPHCDGIGCDEIERRVSAAKDVTSRRSAPLLGDKRL